MATTLTTIKESPDQGCQKLAPRLLSGAGIAIAAVMLSPRAEADEWRVTPTVAVRGTYTDNVRLAPRGAERSDFIAETTPGISVSRNGPGLKLNAKYGLQYLTYANDSEGSKIAHQLSATANAELVKDLFFIDGNAAVHQQNISALGPQSTDNTNVTGNRATVRNYSISPYLRHSFGSTASSEARYTRTSTSTSTGGLSSGDTDALLMSLNSGSAFRTLGWGLQYSQQKQHFREAQTVDSRTTTGSLRYMVSPQLYLTATGGYDKYDYVSTGNEPAGRFYTGGFSWRPTERTSITASAGKRFWGKTYMLESSVRSRMSLWQVSYNEAITTSQAQFAIQTTSSTSDFLNQLFLSTISNPVDRQKAVDLFIFSTGLPPVLSRSVNYFTNQFFLQKSLQASVAITGAKNTVVLSLFNTSRKGQTALSGTDPLLGASSQALDANTRQAGVNALWQWRVTPLTSVSFNAGYARSRLESTDALQKLKTFKAVIATQIQPKLNGGLEFRRQMQTADFAGGDYVENAIAVFLLMQF
jgi:uncharacterized protein (PEP-CTERM system associated)